MKTKIFIYLITFTATLLILSNFVSAFGVGAPYWDTNPLTMAAGETKKVELNLQNMVGDSDVTVKAILKNGSDIARLENDIYTVKINTSDTMVPLDITIPKNATGTKKITVEFKTVTSGEGGGVVMGTGMTVSFDVIISGKVVEETNKALIIIPIVIIVLAIIIIFILRRKRAK